MIKIVNGDLLNAAEPIIGHQVNVFGTMGAGVAFQIAKKYPEVNKSYMAMCEKDNYDAQTLLGKCQLIICQDGKLIANLFSQNTKSDDNGCLTNYDAMRSCFKNLNELKMDVAIPYGIGCGIANGDWNTVYKIIEETCSDINVIIYKI